MAGAGAGNVGGRREQRQWRGQTTINQKVAAKAAEMVIVVAAEMVTTETAAAETNIRFPVTRILKSLPNYIVSLFVYL
jgi:acyl CoA:acetate/3-ketoacid CoA transferase alpha subunit